MLQVLIGVGVIGLLLYSYWASSLTHWKKLKVPHIRPHFLWGNLKDVLYQRKTIFQVYQDIYRKFPNAPYTGLYIINRPGLIMRDPQLIKQIVQNDFASFHDNDLLVDEEVDPIFATNPFVSRGEKWKQRRSAHTVHFSSGKIKNMFTVVGHGGDRMIEFLNDEIKTKGKCTIEGIELSFKFTIYNFGNYTLGIDPRTFDEDNPKMRDMARKIMEPNLYNGIKQLFLFIMPSLSRFLTVRLIPTEVTKSFMQLIKEQLEYRMQNSITRNDFFENIQTYKGRKASIDDMLQLIGNFFLDAATTNSIAINFMLYELAANLEVQRKLAEEVDEFHAKHDGKIPYEEFQEMPYMTAVILESLRKYPPLSILTRACTKPYTLAPVNADGESISVEKDMSVVIPLIALHNDEKYFPDPDKFDPTRFLGANKEAIKNLPYMPFGEGPRTCIGKRLGLLQSRMMLFKLISEFKLRLNPKTKTPIEYDVQSFLLAAKGGIWLNIYKREK